MLTSEITHTLIDVIAGARPNFIKIAPIIHALEERAEAGGLLRYRLVHTGQHYDARMSDDFFEQLCIPQPHVNLEVGSGTQAEQTSRIMIGYENLLRNKRSALCLVVGDVNSTMACAITAQKLQIPVAHVEGGIRSGDWAMPEEINRLVTDSITNWFFTTSDFANKNLRDNGVSDARIFFVGNTMIDTLLGNLHRLRKPDFFDELELRAKHYFVLTLHRPANVDSTSAFIDLLRSIGENTRGRPIIFPVHPRTSRILQAMRGGDFKLPPNLHLVTPQPYLEFNWLVKNALAVITDSGGITEETTVLDVPCMTLRDTTERPETVTLGTNEMIGADPKKLRSALDQLFDGQWKTGHVPPLWDGRTGKRIVEKLEEILGRASRRIADA